MGYDLHITRADLCWESQIYPISRSEWTAFAESEPHLVRHRDPESSGEFWEFLAADGTPWGMYWFQGAVTVWKAYEVGTQLAPIAARLGARVIGDDGEEYHADGSIVPWTAPRPILFQRPWSVEEAVAAWEAIFEQRPGLSSSICPGPDYARHAFGAFRRFSEHPVASADDPYPERLSYGYGVDEDSDSPAFVLRFTRHVPIDADGDRADITCRLDYPMNPDLVTLGVFGASWTVHEGDPRDGWFDTLAARPEWAVFDVTTPQEISFAINTTNSLS